MSAQKKNILTNRRKFAEDNRPEKDRTNYGIAFFFSAALSRRFASLLACSLRLTLYDPFSPGASLGRAISILWCYVYHRFLSR